jgi:hypothetical protein
MMYHSVCTKSNTMGVTYGTGTAHLSGALVFTLHPPPLILSGVRLARSLAFFVVF